MISKHVDLIAVTLLLLAIAAFSGAKHLVVMTFSGPVHYYRTDDSRQVRIPAMPEMPAIPAMPPLPLQRD